MRNGAAARSIAENAAGGNSAAQYEKGGLRMSEVRSPRAWKVGSLAWWAALVVLAALVGGAALWVRPGLRAAPAAAPRTSIPGDAIGNVEELRQLPDGQFYVRGWTLSPGGIGGVVLLYNGELLARVPHALSREDVREVHASMPDAGFGGFEGTVAGRPLTRISTLELVALDRDGRRTTLLKRTLVPDAYRTRWGEALQGRAPGADDVFYIPIATSHVAEGGADGIRESYAPYESRTVKAGIRVQILYMRTTLGARGDYAFDPDFTPDKKCGTRYIAEDSLNGVMRYAVQHRMPVLFTLNGGFWADAACDAPEWDINDVLEQDKGLCQWNEKNEVMPDTALAEQAGSFESPELGRSLSLNVFAAKARHYKKRNLQQAAAIIQRFAQEHPELFIGVNLDADVYINPFFGGKQWYDYNPDTLRQFRDWLRGAGVYAGAGKAGEPNLSAYRRSTVLTLEDVERLAGKHYGSWDEVDPPRSFPLLTLKLWESAWAEEWEHFRRHLVKLHYDELSQWVAQTGIAPNRIYSSQGFMPPGDQFDPLPIRLNSPAKNYDTGGVSIEGAVPTHGRLGAILYGDAALNSVRMEGKESLFAEFRRYSPDWAVVEYNTADLLHPGRMPSHAAGYQSLRDLGNYGARYVSPMAWNGSPGETAGTLGYVSYTSLRRTPLERAIQEFMLARFDLPRAARLWTFGVTEVKDADRWSTYARGGMQATTAGLRLQLDSDGRAQLLSPPELATRAAAWDALVLQVPADEAAALRVSVDAWTPQGAWQPLLPEVALRDLQQSAAGYRIPWASAAAMGPHAALDRVRLKWRGTPGGWVTVGSIALLPAGKAARPERSEPNGRPS